MVELGEELDMLYKIASCMSETMNTKSLSVGLTIDAIIIKNPRLLQLPLILSMYSHLISLRVKIRAQEPALFIAHSFISQQQPHA